MRKMQKIAAMIMAAILLAVPVLATTEQEANQGNVRYEILGYAETPIIDGVLDEFGYSKIGVAPGDIGYSWGEEFTDGAITKSLNFEIWAAYDENYVYFFASYDDTYTYNDLTQDTLGTNSGFGDLWGQTLFGINITGMDETETDMSEIGIGRNSATGELMSKIYMESSAGANEAPKAGEDFQITVANGKINYELRVPYSTFRPAGAKFAEGQQFKLGITLGQAIAEISANQNEQGYIYNLTMVPSVWMPWPPDTDNMATITLGAPIEKPAEEAALPQDGGNEPVLEAPAANEAPVSEEAAQAPEPAPAAPRVGDSAAALAIFAAALLLGIWAKFGRTGKNKA